MTTPPVSPQGVPVSAERIRNCLRSASFWVNELPRYADRQQQRADSWAILAGVLASLTSLAIFPVLTETTTPLAKAIVSAVALLAAICALIPRVKNYAELAGQARAVVTEFGTIKEKRVRNDQGEASSERSRRRRTRCAGSPIGTRSS
jgi:hypothetical protein